MAFTECNDDGCELFVDDPYSNNASLSWVPSNGGAPFWSHDGKNLFTIRGNQLWASELGTRRTRLLAEWSASEDDFMNIVTASRVGRLLALRNSDGFAVASTEQATAALRFSNPVPSSSLDDLLDVDFYTR